MPGPNVLLLICDCLRATDVNQTTMPFLMSKKKIEFKKCYSPSTWTLPSYASLYSMQTPIEHQVTRVGDKLSKEQCHLPSILKRNNYHTSVFSENPEFGSLGAFYHHIDFFDEDIHYKKFPSPTPLSKLKFDWRKSLPVILNGPNPKNDLLNILFGSIRYLKRKLGFKSTSPRNSIRIWKHIKQYVKNTSSTPKAIFTNFLDPHCPYLSSKKGAKLLGFSFSKDEKEAFANFDGRDYILKDIHPPKTNEDEIIFTSWQEFFKRQHDTYLSQIRFLDKIFEKEFQNSSELINNSLVIVTGDHGQLFGEENMYGHHTSLHPNGIHVPLLIFPPDNWKLDQKEVREPVSLIGVAKALSDVAREKILRSSELIETIVQKSSMRDNGEILVTVDGPTWSVRELKRRYEKKKVEKLMIRKIGLINSSKMHTYSSHWYSSKIIHKVYKVKEGDRYLLKEDKITDNLGEKLESWLLNRNAKGKKQIRKRITLLKKKGKI